MTGVTELGGFGAIGLWLIDLKSWSSDTAVFELSESETIQANRLVFSRDRQRYFAAHDALRCLLSERTGASAHSIIYSRGKFGKPFLPDFPSIHFNMSRSDDLTLIAISEGMEIGVDIEVRRHGRDSTDLIQQNFTLLEQIEFENTIASERDLAFLRGWTRKEACLKALGTGLNIAPESFESGLKPISQPVTIETTNAAVVMQVTSLSDHAEYVGAVAELKPHDSAVPFATWQAPSAPA